MKYKLVNLSSGNLQINLHSPEIGHNYKSLNRPGPVVALNLRKGTAIDILPYFDGSVEKAHKSVSYSRDVLRLFGPTLLDIFICDDDNKPIDMKAIFGSVIEDKVDIEDPPELPKTEDPPEEPSELPKTEDPPEEPSELPKTEDPPEEPSELPKTEDPPKPKDLSSIPVLSEPVEPVKVIKGKTTKKKTKKKVKKTNSGK